MERKVPLSKGFLVVIFAIVANLCYYFGVVPALKLCMEGSLYLLYFVCLSAAGIALVVSVSIATWCFPLEVTDVSESGQRTYPLGGFLWESFVFSVIAALVGFFIGNMSAVLFVDASYLFAGYVNVSFPSAELFRFENLFPVFWKPYITAYAISFLLASLVWCDKKYRAHKRKKRKKNQVVC